MNFLQNTLVDSSSKLGLFHLILHRDIDDLHERIQTECTNAPVWVKLATVLITTKTITNDGELIKERFIVHLER